MRSIGQYSPKVRCSTLVTPVAVVVADTLAQAMDAAEAVEVDYEELECVVDVAAAANEEAPIIHEALDTNIVHQVATGDRQATAEAFERAAHVTELVMRNHCITGCPMEPRACVGEYNPRRDHYTLFATTQFPHALSRWIAQDALRVPMQKVRVIAPDVGGGCTSYTRWSCGRRDSSGERFVSLRFALMPFPMMHTREITTPRHEWRLMPKAWCWVSMLRPSPDLAPIKVSSMLLSQSVLPAGDDWFVSDQRDARQGHQCLYEYRTD